MLQSQYLHVAIWRSHAIDASRLLGLDPAMLNRACFGDGIVVLQIRRNYGMSRLRSSRQHERRSWNVAPRDAFSRASGPFNIGL
jgi:hypothetical protein